MRFPKLEKASFLFHCCAKEIAAWTKSTNKMRDVENFFDGHLRTPLINTGLVAGGEVLLFGGFFIGVNAISNLTEPLLPAAGGMVAMLSGAAFMYYGDFRYG